MRVAVMGAGAVGAYVGGRLAQADHDVTLIARGSHLAALQRDVYMPSSVALRDMFVRKLDETGMAGGTDAEAEVIRKMRD